MDGVAANVVCLADIFEIKISIKHILTTNHHARDTRHLRHRLNHAEESRGHPSATHRHPSALYLAAAPLWSLVRIRMSKGTALHSTFACESIRQWPCQTDLTQEL